jgi:hypothetical protein
MKRNQTETDYGPLRLLVYRLNVAWTSSVADRPSCFVIQRTHILLMNPHNQWLFFHEGDQSSFSLRSGVLYWHPADGAAGIYSPEQQTQSDSICFTVIFVNNMALL